MSHWNQAALSTGGLYEAPKPSTMSPNLPQAPQLKYNLKEGLRLEGKDRYSWNSFSHVRAAVAFWSYSALSTAIALMQTTTTGDMGLPCNP